MNRYLILASLLLAAVSCGNGGQEPTEPIVTLTASLADAVSETRVSANTDNDDEWTFTWDEMDRISGWRTECTALTEFKTKDYEQELLTFECEVQPDKDYRFIYPSDIKNMSNNICKIDISNQTSGKELDKTYMINNAMIPSSSLTDKTVSTLSMEHLGAFMVVNVYLENPIADKTYKLKEVKYSSKENAINASAEIDMTKEDLNEIYHSITPGTITANMDVTFTTTDDDSAYLQAITRLNILPSTIKVDQSATVELTIEVYNKVNEELLETLTPSVTLTNTSGNDLPFARATHNFTYLTVKGSQEVEITGATINGWVASGNDESFNAEQ